MTVARGGPAEGPVPRAPVRRPRPAPPPLDAVSLEELATPEELPVETPDGWTLVLTRYRPRPQPFAQPLHGVPLLLVHGYTQNRHAWEAGEFVRAMAYFGIDLFLLELRGHGRSGVELQLRRARTEGRPLPADIEWAWSIDDYLLGDLPAAVAAVKRASGYDRIFYCGHSLGGILGYAYATLYDDLLGLATIGAPADLARMPLWVRAAGWAPLVLFPLVDLALLGANLVRLGARTIGHASGLLPTGTRFEPWRFRRIPFRALFAWLERRLDGEQPRLGSGPVRLPDPLIYRSGNVALSALRPLLREGATDEPRATAEQFGRWLRRGELVCYRLRHDVLAALPRIRIPVAIFFGDEDPFASVATTRVVYRSVSSSYLLWRPVRGNSHLELTMGRDIRQICFDIKNLMTYALAHPDPGTAGVLERVPVAAGAERG